MGDVNLKKKTGFLRPQPTYIEKRKRPSLQTLSSERDSDSDVMQVNARVRKHEGKFSTRKLQDYPNEAQTTIKEWNVLYTTQLTQKTKKYHDGVLRLIFGSHTNQVMLLNEDGNELSSKYLNSFDHIETGHECELPNYLIQICDSRTLSVDNCPSGGSLEQVAGYKNLRMEKSINNIRVTDSKSMLHETKSRHSRKVDCRSSDEDRSMDVNLKSALEWTALYTTQKTQKAKKYHDGILRLVYCGSHMKQIVLLNEDGVVLNSRYLKSTESVETGCTIEFPNYLVEVSELKAPVRDNDPGDSVETVAPCSASKMHTPMYSHRVTGSKSMLNAYVKKDHLEQVVEVSDDSEGSDSNTKSTNEWTAMYTTHKAQKAKKYHDGILRLVNCGSHMKQIILLNEEGEVLNSRYLKSTELVETGRSYEFPNYLVEVSESKTPTGAQAVREVTDKAGANNMNIKSAHEWKVMYTAQLTQKAKRYHDGILRITDHTSQLKQAILLNEDGAVLGSKYFKSAGCIKTGNKFDFPNYLIEICELCAPGRGAETEGGLQEEHLEQVAVCTSSNTEVSCTPISVRKKMFFRDDQKSKVTDIKREVSTSVNNRQIRDASQILSFLRKPVQPQPSDIIELDADNTYMLPDFSAREQKEDIPKGIAIEVHDGHHLQPRFKHDTASLNQLSRKSTLEPQAMKQDMDYDCTKKEELPRSPKYEEKKQSEEEMGLDKSRSLSDEIMNLQQEWTTLSHRASTIGNAQNQNRSKDVHIDEGMHVVSNVNDFPTFDLGF